ncbi:alkaline phosphatase family protein [Rhodoplanes sp. Z2-YC6860]|uniref:alkaline phosphatase family protein n=1 Tax=Rhodoplanes sp. Z2-YC6860 TaxID=674703 RepID=UPI00078C5E9C|nr:alkaline phosphatase family protein [Rhodoplanes sp. Z2-YC6860]AMN44754.1 type I phosphodiesterase/nucleotide pyrophosphatase [Rhodoplanes sp. Z2-YC6860]
MRASKKVLLSTAIAAVLLPAVLAGTTQADGISAHGHRYEHVLLLSIDGFHAVDLAYCTTHNLCPNLAALAQHGTTFANASTTKPSDSFPGMLAQVTGGTPKSAGVYYDDSYDRTFFAPAGNPPAPCTGAPGAETTNAENVDTNLHSIDGGVNASLTGLNSAVAIDPNNLPRKMTSSGCVPVWPHDFVRVNSIFQVIKNHGMRTAWSDKHAAYDIVNGNDPDSQPANGPGTNVDDFFAPEINSDLSSANVQLIALLGLQSTAPAPVTDPTCPGANCGSDFTSSIDGVEYYDGIKVWGTLNQIAGHDHTGTRNPGTPAIFGMNFQSVSVGQKLKTGGYADASGTPGPVLSNAIGFVDRSVGQMVSGLAARGLVDKTLIVISAKHGQSPIDKSKVVKLDDGQVIAGPIGSNFAFDIADDVALIWLKDNSGDKIKEAVDALKNYPGDTGIASFLYGGALTRMFDNPRHDSRAPDIIGITRVGVIYTHGSKIAEHGGFNPDDVHVAMLVSNPRLPQSTVSSPVETRQIAPTILNALGLDPDELEAVKIEHTDALPGLGAERASN